MQPVPSDGLYAFDQEPDQESAEYQLPERTASKGPLTDEHPRHGNSHEDVRYLDVPAVASTGGERQDQKDNAIGRNCEHQNAEEVVQPRRS